jgi:hypothetical protein
MKTTIIEDISGDELNWLIENIDEMFSEQDENENNTR